MPTYRIDLNTGRKVPKFGTDDIADGAITFPKIAASVIQMVAQRVSENLPPATYEKIGLVKPRTEGTTNVSGILVDQDGQIEAVVKRSANSDDIQRIGSEESSPEAAVTMQNVNDVFQHTTIVTNEDFNNIFKY